MADPDGRSRERRWIVLGEDGRFSTLGRNSDPTQKELADVQAALIAQGLAGWLAVMQGNPYLGTTPSIMEVRPLGQPGTEFADAARACISSIMAKREKPDD